MSTHGKKNHQLTNNDCHKIFLLFSLNEWSAYRTLFFVFKQFKCSLFIGFIRLVAEKKTNTFLLFADGFLHAHKLCAIESNHIMWKEKKKGLPNSS